MWRSTLRYAPRYTGIVDAMKDGAGTRSRTKDFHITNVALYPIRPPAQIVMLCTVRIDL